MGEKCRGSESSEAWFSPIGLDQVVKKIFLGKEVQSDCTEFILALVTEVVSVFDYFIGFLDDEGTVGLSTGLRLHHSRCCA